MHIVDRPSPNHDERDGLVDILILHYTGMKTAQDAIDRLRDPAARVSSHYLVDEDGTIIRLVPENRRAWHAGISCWRGAEQLNGRSIGIEIVNPGHQWGYRDFPAAQMTAVADLCRSILSRHVIPRRNVLAHSDVAPDRKEDPGERFDWRGLAAQGIGLWPEDVAGADTEDEIDDEVRLAEIRSGLIDIGYRVAPSGPLDASLSTVLRAFQRHWRQESVTGRADAGTRRRIAAVARLASAN